MFEQFRFIMEKHKGIITVNLDRVKVISHPTKKSLLGLVGGVHRVFKDKRYKNQIMTMYNPRQLTLSFANILHELGHEYMRHHVKTIEPHEILEEELEAWMWARAHWPQVPVARKFPTLYEEACLDSYTRTEDPFVQDYYFDIEREAIQYGKTLEGYQGIGHYII